MTAAVAHQAAGRGELAILVDRGHRVAERQCGELLAPADEECIGADHEPAGPQLGQGCKDRIEVAFGAGMQDMELQPEGAGRRLQRLSIGSRHMGLVGLTSSAMMVAVGTSSCSSSSRFGPSSTFNVVTPVRLPPGRFRLATSPTSTGSAAYREDDRNRRGRRLCRQCRRSAAGRDNHGHLAANQIGRQCRQSIVLALRPAIFDRHVPALDVAGFAQALAERAQTAAYRVRRSRCRETRSPASPAAARAPRAATRPRRREA